MNVLLVKPYNLSDHIQPSIGLGYLATNIRQNHHVHILDCIKDNIKPDNFKDFLQKRAYDIIGFQCYTFDLLNLKKMLKAAKEKGAVTVLGGPHPSVLPVETIEFFGDDLDYCFQGEAEIGFKMFVDKISGKSKAEFKDIPGLVWRDGGKVNANPRLYVDDIDSLGMPAWDLIKPQYYPESQHGAFFENFPIAPISITRGCPYPCTFCAGNLISGKKIRKRSVHNVLSEIDSLYNFFGIREFHVIDDNFTQDKEFAKALLRELKAKKLKISWATPNGVRMETLDDEMLRLMKETGLYLISLGIESGSDKVLKLMKKGTNVDFIRKTVDKIRKADIDVAGFFIIGFPGETIEDIRKTIKFSLELDLIRANYFTYLPFPATESYEEIKKNEGLDKVNWERLYFMSAPYSPEGIKPEELKRLQREAFVRFFFRPRIFIKNISKIKSLKHFKFLLKRFFHWVIMK